MRRLVKLYYRFLVKPYLQHYYLKKDRSLMLHGLKLKVYQGVFHPGLFFSSKFLLEFMDAMDLQGKEVLDVGSGSGALAIAAARAGARVTAVDLNPLAVKNTTYNAEQNRVTVNAVQSDLFSSLHARFQVIFVNPPFYPKSVENSAELAWHTGEGYEYFITFFRTLKNVSNLDSEVFMVLSSDSDVKRIAAIGLDYQWELKLITSRVNHLEEEMIFACTRFQT